MSEANVDLVHAIYDAFARRDIPAIFAHFDPAIEITQSREVPWGGEYKGHNGALEFFGKLTQAIESELEHERLIDAGDSIVQIGRTSGKVRANGAAFDVFESHVWKIKDGKVVRFDSYIDNAKMRAALDR